MSELEPTRTYSNPTATDVLRRLLDERGVEYEGGERSLRWRDRNGVMMQAFPLANGELGLDVWSCTPEQAIAATLGAGTCKRVMNSIDPFAMWACDHCGHPLDTSENFCGGCGRKVVNA